MTKKSQILLGDKVLVDCSDSSRALKAIKNKLRNRLGVITQVFDFIGKKTPFSDPSNVTVKFEKYGRKKEISIELAMDILIKAN